MPSRPDGHRADAGAGQPDSVPGLMQRTLGVTPRQLASQNFRLGGWRYEGQVAHPCPGCEDGLHTMRRPDHAIVQAGGAVKKVTLVALVCGSCANTYLMKDLGIPNAASIRRTTAPDTGARSDPTQARSPAAPARGRPRGGAVADPESVRRAAILSYWRSVEMFTAQQLDEPRRRDLWFRLGAGDAPAPWDPAHDLHHPERWRHESRETRDKIVLREGNAWRHVVYGGVYSLEDLHRRLEGIFGSSGPDVDERTPRGSSAMFAIVVTDEGRLQLDSLTMSSAAWALGRAHRPGPQSVGWLEGFDDAEQAFRRLVDGQLADPAAAAVDSRGNEMPQSSVVGGARLEALVRLAVTHLGLTAVLVPGEIRVHSEQVSSRHQHDQTGVILNSFYLTDLQRVSGTVRDGSCGPALAAYLSSPAQQRSMVADRVDVLTSRHSDLLGPLAPRAAPAGRWPATSVHPLATSQQYAINRITEQLAVADGLFGVNGPPGTGKTTMLRDLLAAVVVERAAAMARLPDPHAAFGTSELAWRTSTAARRVHRVPDVLTGFEIVVASSNNEAVANVTREIPAAGAVGDAWAAEARYFPDHASRLLGQPAWGLVAAVLGNAKNRSAFVSGFWEPPAANAPAPVPTEPVTTGFRAWLDGHVAAPPPREAWRAAVDRFDEARRVEAALRRQRHVWHEALLISLPAAEARRDVAAAAIVDLEEAVRNGDADLVAAAARHQDSLAAQAAADRVVAAHDRLEPGVWSRIVTFGRVSREWRTDGEPLWTAARAAAEEERDAGEVSRGCADQLRQTRNAHVAARAALSAAELDCSRARLALDGAAAACGDTLPDARWLADPDQREKFGPWLDASWNAARTRVFLAGLHLHEAFLAAAAGPVRTNLDAAMAILRGTAPRDAPPERLRTAWQTLFLVVPAVSTTFASVDRLFGGLAGAALGWLLIDEAGQATPQAAAGAIHRARRVVAVGDPLQLEPIVGALHTTQAALARYHGVDPFWLPDQLSVQGLADRVTPVGTELPGENGDVWVGAPLRVHRRCDRPIFELFNQPVYRGLMTYGKPPEAPPLVGRGSAWLDVRSQSSDGNWVPAEGEALAALLTSLLDEGIRRGQILTISPFRRAATGVRQVLDVHGLQEDRLAGGTVHTAQGKEADVVVLVLGGDPQRPGAADWAASKPNLFNVAVSRARQRLFVIGDRSRWVSLPYFRELAVLPVVETTGS